VLVPSAPGLSLVPSPFFFFALVLSHSLFADRRAGGRAGAQVLVSGVFTVLIVLALVDEAVIRWTRYRDDGARRAAAAKISDDHGDDAGAEPWRGRGEDEWLPRPPLPASAPAHTTAERASNDVAYYAAHWGYTCTRHRAVTADGFVLELFRVGRTDVAPRRRAVVLQHGLFMSPGIFVTNERDSLAFLLADLGCVTWEMGLMRRACVRCMYM
jgi:hypothetical protein